MAFETFGNYRHDGMAATKVVHSTKDGQTLEGWALQVPSPTGDRGNILVSWRDITRLRDFLNDVILMEEKRESETPSA